MRIRDFGRHLLGIAAAAALLVGPASAQAPGGFLPSPLDVHLLVAPAPGWLNVDTA